MTFVVAEVHHSFLELAMTLESAILEFGRHEP